MDIDKDIGIKDIRGTDSRMPSSSGPDLDARLSGVRSNERVKRGCWQGVTYQSGW